MKQMKVLTVFAALAMTLGLSACGGKKECKTHQWGTWETTKAATCQEAGSEKRVCKKCGKEQTRSVDKLEHQWEEVAGSKVEATCTTAGSYSRKCSVCQTQEDNVAINALGHDWGEWEDVDAATCTAAGSHKHTCQRCQTEESETVQALGHDWGEWEETLAPTCTEKGSHKHTCQRCQIEESEDIDALDHDIHLREDTTEPEEGKAAVRIFECSRCDVTYFGFKATEVTNDSKQRLVFESTTGADGKEEQGARFFGHPIGNDCELDPETGDPSEGVAEVYSKEQTGDYFEYKFNLTADQVAAISGDEGACLCYVDALPANWMQQNNMDFFAKGGETDWTKAYYIDDDPAHYNEDGSAKEIEGWRYVLYVDGQYQDFDATVASNPMRNNDRGTFVMPYLFKLHTNENVISLRMAAGYRCTFYSFTFRPYVAPGAINVSTKSIDINVGETAQIESQMEGLSYKSADTSVATVSSTGLVTGVRAGETKITVSKEGNYRSVEIPVTVTKVGHDHAWGGETPVAAKGEGYVGYRVSRCTADDADKISIRALDGTFADGSSNKSGTREGYLKLNSNGNSISYKFDYQGEATKAKLYQVGFMDSWANNTTRTYTSIQSGQSVGANGCNFGVNFNNEEVEIGDVKNVPFNELLADATIDAGSGNSKAGPCLIGEVNLKNGDNEFTFKRYASYNLAVSDFEIVIPAHKHAWGEDTPVAAKGEGYVGYKTAECSLFGDAKRLSVRALDGTFAAGSSNKSGTREGYLKLNSNGNSISYKFDYQGEATKAKLYQVGFMDSWANNTTRTYTSIQSGQSVGANGCNFGVNFNNEEVEIGDVKNVPFNELLADATIDAGSGNSKAGPCLIGEVNLKNGDNEFTLTRYASFNLVVSDFWIVF